MRALAALLVALALPAAAADIKRCGPSDGPECLAFTNNTNRIDLSMAAGPAPICNANEFRRRYRRAPCPTDTVWVCDAALRVSVCLDRTLRTGPDRRPLGGQTREACAAWCETRDRRLPTNHEYLTGCRGTPVEACLPAEARHPIIARLQSGQPWQVEDTNCRAADNAWRQTCMSDQSLNAPLNRPRPRCVTPGGLRDMAGVLGQWVSDPVERPGRTALGQFNGGFWAQPTSSCSYTTTAHPPDWSDYSIGCRCALDAVR